MAALALDRPMLGMSLVLVYLVLGALSSWLLARRGQTLAVVASALVGWPLFLGELFAEQLGEPPPLSPIPPGPNAERITRCVASLRGSLAGSEAATLIPAAQLASLEHALREADRRLASVDHLIAELGSEALASASLSGALATLRRARAHAAAELEQVLDSLVQLRVQLGVHTLIGSAAVEPVRERLAELEARVAALAEISSLTDAPACAQALERHAPTGELR